MPGIPHPAIIFTLNPLPAKPLLNPRRPSPMTLKRKNKTKDFGGNDRMMACAIDLISTKRVHNIS